MEAEVTPIGTEVIPMGSRNGALTREHLALTLSFEGPACTVALRGSLDIDSSIALESQFDQLTYLQLDKVIVDIDGLRHLDEAGARTLQRLGALVAGAGLDLFLKDGRSTIECTEKARPPDGWTTLSSPCRRHHHAAPRTGSGAGHLRAVR